VGDTLPIPHSLATCRHLPLPSLQAYLGTFLYPHVLDSNRPFTKSRKLFTAIGCTQGLNCSRDKRPKPLLSSFSEEQWGEGGSRQHRQFSMLPPMSGYAVKAESV
jgi:hypothetical protein